jgi:hypothetical protein
VTYSMGNVRVILTDDEEKCVECFIEKGNTLLPGHVNGAIHVCYWHAHAWTKDDRESIAKKMEQKGK